MNRAKIGILALVAAAVLSACKGPTIDHLASAKAAIASQDSSGALVHLKNAVAASPTSAEARLLLGKQTLAAGDAAAAVIDLRRARELKAPDDEVVPELALAMLQTGQTRLLLDQLGSVRLNSPAAAASFSASLALAHAGVGSLPLARKAASEALTTAPDDPRVQLVSAQVTAAAGDGPGALAEVEALLRMSPRNDEAWAFKGELLSRLLGKEADAEAAYAKALAINPTQTQSLTAVVGLNALRGDLPKARAALEALRKAAPKMAAVAYYEARLSYLSGNFKQARSQFQALLSTMPENPQVLLASGLNELRLNAPIQAVGLLSAAVNDPATSVAARFYLAQAQLQLGKPDQAATVLAPLLGATANPSADVLVLAAQARLIQGDASGANALFTRAEKLGSKDPEVRTALAIGRSAFGETDASIRELQLIADTTDSVAADMKLISSHLSQNRIEAALKAIDALERKQPSSPVPSDLRGQVLAQQKNFGAARKAFELALQKDKGYLPAIFYLAEIDVLEDQPEAARKRLAALQASEPTNVRVLLAQASLAVRTGGSSDEILKLLERATQIDPRDVGAWTLLAEYQLRSGNVPTALVTAQAAVAALPDNVNMLILLARSQMNAGDQQQAVSTYGKVIQTAPTEPAGYLGQATALMAMGDLNAAASALQKLMAIDPRSVDGQRLLAGVALKRGLPRDALSIASNLQRQDPASAFGNALEGEIELEQRNFSAGIAAFRKGMTKPNGAELAPRLHVALLLAGKAKDASAFSNTWLQANPKDVAFLAYLGDSAFISKDYATAEQSYLRALSIEPNLPMVLNNLSWSLLNQKKPGALAAAERAIALAPNHPNVLTTLAEVLLSEDQPKKALDALKLAINRSPNPATLRLTLAKFYIKLDERDNAAVELEKLVALGRGSPTFAEARRLAGELRQR